MSKSIFKILLSILILTILAFRIDFSALNTHVNFAAWLLASGLIMLQVIGLSMRWKLLVKEMNFFTAIRLTLISSLANYLFITSIGGIVVRVALSVNHGISFLVSLTATFLDRLMTLCALCILAVIFMPISKGIFDPNVVNPVSAISLIVLGCLSFILLYKKREIIKKRVNICYEYVHELLTDPQRIAKIVAISVMAQIMYFGAVYIILESLVDLPLLHFMALLPLITIIASLPLGYGGWGIREGAFVYGLGLANIPAEVAFIASVQIGLIGMLTAILAAIPAFLHSETRFAIQEMKWKKPVQS